MDYTPYTEAVQKAQEIAGGLTEPKEIFAAVTAFMESEFTYDFVRAKKIKAAVLPDIES